MKNLGLKLLLISITMLYSCSSLVPSNLFRSPSQDYSYHHHERVNFKEVLLGIEYSFQDEEIVGEPGRMTFRTQHKGEKFDEFFEAYSQKVGVTHADITDDTSHGSFKPGYKFTVPDDGTYTINMEPVTIEVNTTPKTIEEIIPTSSKIFEAAKEVDLVPYVNPAAERSGMGHIHVGAKTLRESPIYKNPLLLRNILAYYHKHPSLLYGFAEAYDIGGNSNIETYHDPVRQRAFKRVLDEFDDWYFKTRKTQGDLSQGLAQFLRILKANEPPGSAFCHHYRVVNLEHICKLNPDNLPLDTEGKYTLEHRAFRPQKDPQTAHANAHLLLDLYEKLSTPNYLVPFEEIGPKAFKRFWTATKIKNDWERVKRFIGHSNPYSDEMVAETVSALESQLNKVVSSVPNSTLRAAFSQKENKGHAFELKVESHDKPLLKINARDVEFERIDEGEVTSWIAYIDAKELELSPESLINEEEFQHLGFERAKRLEGFWSIRERGTNHVLLFPRYKGEELSKTLTHYEEAITKDSPLKELLGDLFPLKDLLHQREVQKIEFADMKSEEKPSMLLLANRPSDYKSTGQRIEKFVGAFNRHGANTYILPVSIDSIMSEVEAAEFRQAVANSFDSMVAMGGADIDPKLYGQEITYSVMVNSSRDLSEYKMLKSYNEAGKGVTFGVCRGAQLCAVVQGESMIQDLEIEGGITETQKDGVWREIKITEESSDLLYQMVGSKNLNTLNYHHQMIDIRDGSKLKDLVYRGENDQKVLKAYTFKNNRGLGLQFHPEFMDNEDGENILKGMVNYTSAVKKINGRAIKSCSDVMQLLLLIR